MPEAIGFLGTLYLNGRPYLAKNSKKAAKLFKRAAELGNLEAMAQLGYLYERGEDGVKLDKRKAMRLFRVAADRGLAQAQNTLAARLFADGDLEGSTHYLRLAAEKGLIAAQRRVGMCYVHGSGAERDFEGGMRWLSRAAAQGDEEATRLLNNLNDLKQLADNRGQDIHAILAEIDAETDNL